MPVESRADNAGGAHPVFRHDVRVALRHLDAPVAKHVRDELQGDASRREPACIGMPERVEDDFLSPVGNALVEAQLLDGPRKGMRTQFDGVPLVRTKAGKEGLVGQQRPITLENGGHGRREIGMSAVPVLGLRM